MCKFGKGGDAKGLQCVVALVLFKILLSIYGSSKADFKFAHCTVGAHHNPHQNLFENPLLMSLYLPHENLPTMY